MNKDDIIYAQVLLLDNKIEAWKICQDMKHSPLDFKTYWKVNRINDYTMETEVFYKDEVNVPDGWDFNSYVYDVLAKEFINQWEYANDYKGGKAKVLTLEQSIEDRRFVFEY